MQPTKSSPDVLESLVEVATKVSPGIAPKMMDNGAVVWEFNSPVISDISAWTVMFHDVSIGLLNIDAVYRRYAALINHARPRKISWRRLNRHQRMRALELYESGRL